MIRIAVSGCRNADWFGRVFHSPPLCFPEGFSEILVGDAKGVDEYVTIWCQENDIPYKRFRADWAKYGRAAGPIRNQQMIEEADMLYAYWDGKSRGTKSAIDLARKKGIPVYIYNVDNPTELL